jgi:hypothetical protein
MSRRFVTPPPARPRLHPSRRRWIHGDLQPIGSTLPPRPYSPLRSIAIALALFLIVYSAGQLLRPVL